MLRKNSPSGGIPATVRSLLIVLAFAVFLTPMGALPVQGAGPLPHHVAGPALERAHPTIAPIPSSASLATSPEIRAATASQPGPALSASDLAALHPLTLRYPVPGMETGAAPSKPPLRVGAGVLPAPGSAGVGAPLDLLGRLLQNHSEASDLPRSAGYSVPIGTVSGFINDSTDRLGIAGVPVQVYSTSLCSTARCPPTATTSNGSFLAICAAGGGPGSDDAIVITGTNWYMDNESHFVCVANTNVWIGTIYLVRDGVAIGYVKDMVSLKGIAGVAVQAVSRDGSIVGYPAGATGPNGSYEIAVPPVPTKITYTPPTGYLGSFNYTNATPGTGPRPQHPPWEGGVNLGIMYLEHETLVTASFYDSVSLQPVSNPAALQSCDALGKGCLIQGTAGASKVGAFAVPGINYFIATAANYVETSTPAQMIPLEAPGTSFSIGKIWLTPIGSFKVKNAFSTPSGGTPPFVAPNSPSGSIFVSVCSLDGYSTGFVTPTGNLSSGNCNAYGCWNLGQTGTAGAPPLRSLVQVFNDWPGDCSISGPQWPMPSKFAPVWINFTNVNLTAGHLLAAPDPVWLNFTIGDYIAGHAYVTGTNSAPTCFTVTQSSTDNVYWDHEPYSWISCAPTPPSYAACQTLAPQTAGSFCLAVPPGNTKITVTAGGYSTNWTWVHTPTYCCAPQPSGDAGWPSLLATSSANHITSVNLTPLYGKVWGYATEGPTGSTPVPIATVQVCPAPLLQPVDCQGGFGYNGTFYDIPAPGGPDVVTVSAAGFAPDSIWINASVGENLSIGTIPLYPLGVLGGRVVNPQGQGLYLAQVHYCPIASPTACYSGSGINLGTGLTGTDGRYNGTVLGGWLPWTTYVLAASAPGYSTDFTFGNATSGGFTTLPTLTLQPVGVNGSRPLGPAASGPASPAAPSGGTWITGRLLDNRTGASVIVPPGGGLNSCPFGGLVCIPIVDGSNSAGFFNSSIASGLYFINITANGYVPASIFINASRAGFLDLGVIELTPEPWVSGRIVINQWPSVTLGPNGTFGTGYAPAASVEGCDPGRSICFNALPVATTGAYNVTVPEGTRATIVASPTGAALGASPAGGFDGNVTTVGLTGYWTNLSGTSADLGLDIFGVVYGQVWDNDSLNASVSGAVPAYPLAYPSVSVIETGNHTGSATFPGDASGVWTFFLPGGNGPNHTRYQATATGYTLVSGVIAGALPFGDRPVGPVNASLNRFGWVQLQLEDSNGSAGVPYVTDAATGTDPYDGLSYTSTEVANQAGFLNLSAIAAPDVKVVLGAPDYNGSSITIVRVNRSATSFPNGTGIDGVGILRLPAYGWIIATSLNFSGGGPPPISTLPNAVVVDTANGYGVPGATIAVNSADPSVPSGGSPPYTNWAGQFYSDAPIGAQDHLLVERPGFVTNDSIHSVSAGEFVVLGTVNMTGDAVLAGRVVSDPYSTPIAGATIHACVAVKTAQQCTDGVSNLSGSFWIASAPGDIALTVSAPNFVSSTSFVQACSDCWASAGTIALFEYATVTGLVRGLPSGFPIIGANVSLCADTASPAGPCGPAVQSDKYGHFAISAPPSSYILMASDPNFNSTYLPVALSPGQTTTVGTLFLSQFGTATGTIYNGATFGPLMGAAVYGCAQFGQGTCAPLQTTGANGQYSFSAAPGPYEVSVTAQNFQSADGFVRIAAGITTTVSPIILYPIGTDNQIELSGRVVEQANVSRGLADAVLTAFSANASAASTPTASDGTFQLWVAYGTYLLQAAKDGYQAANLTVVAHQTLSGILFELSPKLYEVRGVITDGLNTQPLDNATIWNTTGTGSSIAPLAPLTTTDASGLYVLHLANGTHVLEATGPASSAVTYATLVFTVAVNGASSVHNQSMTPPLVVLNGRVIDAATGLALPNAAVQIQGTLADGYHYARTFTTGADGSFATTVYAGSYTATTSYQQYLGKTQTFEASGSVSYVTLSLTPTGAHGTAGAGTPAWTLWAAGGVAVLAVLGAALWAGRWGRFRPTGTGAQAPAPPTERLG